MGVPQSGPSIITVMCAYVCWCVHQSFCLAHRVTVACSPDSNARQGPHIFPP